MKKLFQGKFAAAALTVAFTTASFAQAPAAAPAGAPAAGPTPAEITDVQAIQKMPGANEKDIAARAIAVEAFATKFPTSSLRGYLFTATGDAYQQVQNAALSKAYYEKAIAADPNSDYAMVMLGAQIANATKEFDLDKDQKLTRAAKLANDAIAIIGKRQKQPGETDQQFDEAKKDDLGRAHMTLGLVANANQKYEDAGKEFIVAVDTSAHADASNLLRAGMAFNQGKKYDDAAKALDRFLAIPGLPDQYRKLAEDQKKLGEQAKKGK